VFAPELNATRLSGRTPAATFGVSWGGRPADVASICISPVGRLSPVDLARTDDLSRKLATLRGAIT
jgi:hypothetical protein